ncbi:helix-hairpin-helix domain-containing protein [Psychromonas sp. RZ22]|uniref:ComEA family DNA-binding protein n=1 Tax=Psychromonas algarum TaxID=2555643 RepID=UPI001068D232|nr:helix-hairpin-helix domain-containing protein [Psychromonas sp. RZ22]TEW54225.1 helix-hairpin-helix domain-containing protein [Psychromonas sp. RZ22]
MMYKLPRRLILIASLFLLPMSVQPLLAAEVKSVVMPGIEKININMATVDQLSLIKGLGSKKAQAIIDYRTENGKFSDLKELMEVKGIGESTLQKITPYLTL